MSDIINNNEIPIQYSSLRSSSAVALKFQWPRSWHQLSYNNLVQLHACWCCMGSHNKSWPTRNHDLCKRCLDFNGQCLQRCWADEHWNWGKYLARSCWLSLSDCPDSWRNDWLLKHGCGHCCHHNLVRRFPC